jgi:hypothetical protein
VDIRNDRDPHAGILPAHSPSGKRGYSGRLHPPISLDVFWWFQRGDSYVRYESRRNEASAYELRFVDADGHEVVERFDNEEDLAARQRILEQKLIEDGWSGPHGWNL